MMKLTITIIFALSTTVFAERYYWQLDKLNQRSNILDGNSGGYDKSSMGEGTDIYIIESSVEEHEGFEISEYYSCNYFECSYTTPPETGAKHGNAVTGIAAGTAGVGRKAQVIVYAHNHFEGLEIAILSAIGRAKSTGRPSIINMSFGCSMPGTSGCIQLVERRRAAIRRELKNADGTIYDKIMIVKSAGNDGNNRCSDTLVPFYDEMYGNFLEVGNIKKDGERSSSSNYGECVQIYAPGNNIYTTGLDNSYIEISGTSFSAPLTAGVISSVWGDNPTLSSSEIKEIILSNSTDATIEGFQTKVLYYNPGNVVENSLLIALIVMASVFVAACIGLILVKIFT